MKIPFVILCAAYLTQAGVINNDKRCRSTNSTKAVYIAAGKGCADDCFRQVANYGFVAKQDCSKFLGTTTIPGGELTITGTTFTTNVVIITEVPTVYSVVDGITEKPTDYSVVDSITEKPVDYSIVSSITEKLADYYTVDSITEKPSVYPIDDSIPGYPTTMTVSSFPYYPPVVPRRRDEHHDEHNDEHHNKHHDEHHNEHHVSDPVVTAKVPSTFNHSFPIVRPDRNPKKGRPRSGIPTYASACTFGEQYASACIHYGVHHAGFVVGSPRLVLETVTRTVESTTTTSIPVTSSVCDPVNDFGLLHHDGYAVNGVNQNDLSIGFPTFGDITTKDGCCAKCFETPGCLVWFMDGHNEDICRLYVSTEGTGSDATGQCPNGLSSIFSLVGEGDGLFGLGACAHYMGLPEM